MIGVLDWRTCVACRRQFLMLFCRRCAMWSVPIGEIVLATVFLTLVIYPDNELVGPGRRNGTQTEQRNWTVSGDINFETTRTTRPPYPLLPTRIVRS